MYFRNIFIGLIFGAALLSAPGLTFAQDSRDLKLNLKGEKTTGTPATAAPLGEFRISLGSQFLGSAIANDNSGSSHFFAQKDDLTLRRTPWVEEERRLQLPSEAKTTTTLSHREQRELGSTMTLTASYFQDQFGRFSPVPRTIGARKNLGRWAVYGELEQKDASAIRLSGKRESVLQQSRPMMNVIANGNLPQRQEIKTVAPSEESVFAALKNYYLEAIYSFHPLFKGKLSYERSQDDPLDRNENLQLEGIVEPGKDLLIKAGYRNQTAPELRERKVPGDTKVWTEFIFKF